MPNVRVQVLIIGRVQGVGFRAWTVRTASALGLTGWVRNTADDSVEATFEGDELLVEKMLAECSRGPQFSDVREVTSERQNFTGEFLEFHIRR